MPKPKKRAAKRAPHRGPVTPAGVRTRDALLDAGVAVAARDGLGGLSVNTVVAEAAVAKGTFYVHFANREAFIDAIHARFYAQVGAAITEAVRDLRAGAARVLRGIDAYLDACLAQRAIKALLLEARSEAHLTAKIAAREKDFAELIAPNLAALGWAEPRTSARLVVAMTSEVALLELEAGRRQPAARRALRSLVERVPGERES